MWPAAREMEYLGATGDGSLEDAQLAQELGRRLEALRRYDQHFCDSDWRPRANRKRPSRRKQSR